jgi:hypothetical protein
MDALVSIKIVILSGLEAHHTKSYVSLYWTSGKDPSSRLVRELLVAEKHQKDSVVTIQYFTYSAMTDSVNHHQVIIMGDHHIAIRCLLRSLRQDRAL